MALRLPHSSIYRRRRANTPRGQTTQYNGCQITRALACCECTALSSMSTWTRHDQYGGMDTCTLTVSRPSAVDLGQCWTRYAVRYGSHVPPRAGCDANGPRCVPSCGPRYGRLLKLRTRGGVRKPSVGMNGPRRHTLPSGVWPSTRSARTLRPEYLYAHTHS